MKHFFVALAVLLSAASVLAEQASFDVNPVISVPKMGPLPVDAVLSAEKMQKMTGMTGYSVQQSIGKDKMGGMIVTPLSDFFVGTDGTDLRFFARSGIGPSGLLARAKPGNAGTFAFFDDCFELVIYPRPHDKNSDGFHFIVTSRGAYMAECRKNRMPVVWKPEFRYQSKADDKNKIWNFELALPLKQFGIAEWKNGQEIGFRVVRNWRRLVFGSFGLQTAWGRAKCEFFSPAGLPLVRLDEQGPVVRMIRMCNDTRTVPQLDVEFSNPTAKPVTLLHRYMFKPENSHSVDHESSLTLAPGEKKLIRYNIPQMALNESAQTYLKVWSPEDGRIFYQRSWVWKLGNPPFFAKAKNSTAEKVIFKYAFYPVNNSLFLQFNAEQLFASEFSRITGFSLLLKDKQGKVLAEKALPKPVKKITEFHWFVPDLKAYTKTQNPSGDYTMEITVNGLKGIRYTKHFQRKVFRWEGNQIGKSDILVPPFTAIRVKGNTVSTILRDHEMNGIGLWRQITADSRKLLTDDGMEITARMGGKDHRASGTLSIGKKTPTQVEFKANWQAGTLQAAVRGSYDFDGMMRYNLTLQPCSEKIDSLKIRIPMDPEIVCLMHVCTDLIRSNYGGAIPKGNGVVWKSSDAVRRHIQTSFVPYIWTGMETSGLSVFAESDRNWVPSEKLPAQQLLRRNGKVYLELNLIAEPVKLDKARTIELGFQATPVKPMPENWRRMIHWGYPSEKLGSVSKELHQYLVYEMEFRGNSPSRGGAGKYGSSGVTPRDDDMAMWNKMEEIVKKKQSEGKAQPIPCDFLDAWVKGYRGPKEDLDYYRRLSREGFAIVCTTRRPITWYTDIRGIILDNPEGRTFLDDWCIGEFQNSRDVVKPYEYDDYGLDPVPSYQDYAIWWEKIMMQKITQDIFWDCPFLISNFNRSGALSGYVLPNGKIQPSMGLFNMRELIRRTAVMELEMGRQPRNTVHMTNANLIPVVAFSQISVDWEDNRGVKPYQERYTREYIRAVSSGRQAGNLGCGLSLVVLESPEAQYAMRTAAGVALTHEISYSQTEAKDFWTAKLELYKFGYGLSSVRVHNYWDKQFPVQISGKPAALYLEKGKEAMLVVSDYDHLKNYTAVLPGKIRSAKRLLDGKTCTFNDRTLYFALEKYDFAVIHLTLE